GADGPPAVPQDLPVPGVRGPAELLALPAQLRCRARLAFQPVRRGAADPDDRCSGRLRIGRTGVDRRRHAPVPEPPRPGGGAVKPPALRRTAPDAQASAPFGVRVPDRRLRSDRLPAAGYATSAGRGLI